DGTWFGYYVANGNSVFWGNDLADDNDVYGAGFVFTLEGMDMAVEKSK
ncbi:MAG: hypothetical protein ACI9JY_000899, partial [Saprospiraceae bacterium]